MKLKRKTRGILKLGGRGINFNPNFVDEDDDFMKSADTGVELKHSKNGSLLKKGKGILGSPSSIVTRSQSHSPSVIDKGILSPPATRLTRSQSDSPYGNDRVTRWQSKLCYDVSKGQKNKPSTRKEKLGDETVVDPPKKSNEGGVVPLKKKDKEANSFKR